MKPEGSEVHWLPWPNLHLSKQAVSCPAKKYFCQLFLFGYLAVVKHEKAKFRIRPESMRSDLSLKDDISRSKIYMKVQALEIMEVTVN